MILIFVARIYVINWIDNFLKNCKLQFLFHQIFNIHISTLISIFYISETVVYITLMVLHRKLNVNIFFKSKKPYLYLLSCTIQIFRTLGHWKHIHDTFPVNSMLKWIIHWTPCTTVTYSPLHVLNDKTKVIKKLLSKSNFKPQQHLCYISLFSCITWII